jgi:hypothetical protein
MVANELKAPLTPGVCAREAQMMKQAIIDKIKLAQGSEETFFETVIVLVK